jgi:hypothetical protein
MSRSPPLWQAGDAKLGEASQPARVLAIVHVLETRTAEVLTNST